MRHPVIRRARREAQTIPHFARVSGESLSAAALNPLSNQDSSECLSGNLCAGLIIDLLCGILAKGLCEAERLVDSSRA